MSQLEFKTWLYSHRVIRCSGLLDSQENLKTHHWGFSSRKLSNDWCYGPGLTFSTKNETFFLVSNLFAFASTVQLSVAQCKRKAPNHKNKTFGCREVSAAPLPVCSVDTSQQTEPISSQHLWIKDKWRQDSGSQSPHRNLQQKEMFNWTIQFNTIKHCGRKATERSSIECHRQFSSVVVLCYFVLVGKAFASF